MNEQKEILRLLKELDKRVAKIEQFLIANPKQANVEVQEQKTDKIISQRS